MTASHRPRDDRRQQAAPNTLTGTQINESKLARVPLSHVADLATTAGSATRAQSAANADHAASADTASHARAPTVPPTRPRPTTR